MASEGLIVSFTGLIGSACQNVDLVSTMDEQ